MSELTIFGVLAVIIGLGLLVKGGAGHSTVSLNIREGTALSQAWFIILVLGFLLILLDTYLA